MVAFKVGGEFITKRTYLFYLVLTFFNYSIEICVASD